MGVQGPQAGLTWAGAENTCSVAALPQREELVNVETLMRRVLRRDAE